VVEKPPPGTRHGRGDDEPERVDEAGGQQGAAEPRAAVDLELPSRPCPQRADGLDSVAAQHGRRVPAPSVRVLLTTYLGNEFIRR